VNQKDQYVTRQSEQIHRYSHAVVQITTTTRRHLDDGGSFSANFQRAGCLDGLKEPALSYSTSKT